MDNLTHSLFALTLARTRLGRVGRGTTLALVVASNAPDVDVVSAFAGGTGSYLRWHRGPTHGFPGIIALGCASGALAWAVCRFWKRHDDEPPDGSLGPLMAVSMLAVLFHVLMDLPTSYGTRLLSPFDWHWFAVDWMPIVDIYLLAALGAGLLFGRVSPDARRRNASLALVLMMANYGIRAVAHDRALALAPRLFGAALPQPCSLDRPPPKSVEYWPRAAVALPNGRRCLVDLAAMPTFTSPFEWRVIAHSTNSYEVQEVNVLDARFLSPAPPTEMLSRVTRLFPDVWTPTVLRAATTVTAQAFLGFSRFPVPRAVTGRAGVTTVRWTDLRFEPSPGPFAAQVRVAADGGILQEQFTR